MTKLQSAFSGGELLTHQFESGDSRAISLTRNFVAVAFGEKRYKTWDEFSHEVERAKSAAESEYQPAYYSRIGLRYKDVIVRTSIHLDEVPWRDLIRPDLLGALADNEIEPQIKGIRSEVLLNIEDVPNGAAKLVHGLIDKKLADGRTEIAYLLDIDFYIEGTVAGDDVRGILDRFNRHAGNFFRWAVSPRLAAALGPIAVQLG